MEVESKEPEGSLRVLFESLVESETVAFVRLSPITETHSTQIYPRFNSSPAPHPLAHPRLHIRYLNSHYPQSIPTDKQTFLMHTFAHSQKVHLKVSVAPFLTILSNFFPVAFLSFFDFVGLKTDPFVLFLILMIMASLFIFQFCCMCWVMVIYLGSGLP